MATFSPIFTRLHTHLISKLSPLVVFQLFLICSSFVPLSLDKWYNKQPLSDPEGATPRRANGTATATARRPGTVSGRGCRSGCNESDRMKKVIELKKNRIFALQKRLADIAVGLSESGSRREGCRCRSTPCSTLSTNTMQHTASHRIRCSGHYYIRKKQYY